MPRGRGIYRDEPRDKLEQNIDAVKGAEKGDRPDRDVAADGGDSPEPIDPPD